MNVDLNGRIALVTGAAQGIGKAIADVLAVNGARVIYADIDLETAQQSASRFSGCYAVSMNVADETQVNAGVSDIASKHSRIDILVNNAGINTLKHRVTIDEFPREEWDKILAVDLTGLYLVSKAVSRQMLLQERPGGRIINIASVGGLVPLRLQCAFIAAKAGVVNLTRAMAIELGSRNILTNCIAPGSILTDGTTKLFYGDDGTFKANVRQLLDHIPLGRPGSSEEVAHAALFLAAPESSYINGHILTVDGGWTAGYTRDF
jgi:NAD(P)-dependent dehydrogenase (short-subunit alcohol dehydrogenase family)